MKHLFRALPSVDQALSALESDGELARIPRPMVRELVNEFLDVCREEIRSGAVASESELALERLAGRMAAHVRTRSRPHFRRVLNATGVVVHTNMGRSLLAPSAVDAVVQACSRYSNLEFDLATGERGSRYSHVESFCARSRGAESALVVNNNASAVFITLETLAKGREAIVSRGQLVEIGGSFRIPDVMAKSGAVLREVGTTNRTHVKDYVEAIGENTALIMKVHTSNYRIVGFSKDVSMAELRVIGDEHGLPVYEDLGSGNFYYFSGMGLGEEPTVQAVMAQGADVCSFSGDKVLGGPQAGVIVGRKRYVDQIKKNPLNRAVRIDKMTLAALEATLRLYLDPEQAVREVPTLSMILADPDLLKRRARRLGKAVSSAVGEGVKVGLRLGASRVGGGSFPEARPAHHAGGRVPPGHCAGPAQGGPADHRSPPCRAHRGGRIPPRPPHPGGRRIQARGPGSGPGLRGVPR